MIALAVVIAAVLGLLLCWHLHWRGMVAQIAAIAPRPGVVLPPVRVEDAALARDAAAWLHWERPVLTQEDHEDLTWAEGGTGPASAHTQKLYEQGAPVAAALPGLLARGWHDGRVAALVAGKRPEDGEFDRYAMVSVARELMVQARLDGDAGPALDAFAPVTDALTPADGVDGLEMLAFVAHLRDEAYVAAAITGRLSPERLRAWAEGPEEVGPAVMGALEGERRYWRPGWFAAEFAEGPFRQSPSGFTDGADEVRSWWGLPEKLARDEGDLSARQDAFARDGVVMDVGGQWDVRVIGAQVLMHRSAVLAARVAARAAEGGLPADGAATPAWLAEALAGGRGRLALRYVRVDARTFAIEAEAQARQPQWAVEHISPGWWKAGTLAEDRMFHQTILRVMVRMPEGATGVAGDPATGSVAPAATGGQAVP